MCEMRYMYLKASSNASYVKFLYKLEVRHRPVLMTAYKSYQGFYKMYELDAHIDLVPTEFIKNFSA